MTHEASPAAPQVESRDEALEAVYMDAQGGEDWGSVDTDKAPPWALPDHETRTVVTRLDSGDLEVKTYDRPEGRVVGPNNVSRIRTSTDGEAPAPRVVSKDRQTGEVYKGEIRDPQRAAKYAAIMGQRAVRSLIALQAKRESKPTSYTDPNSMWSEDRKPLIYN